MKTRITLILLGLAFLVFYATRAFAVEGGLGRPISGMSITPFVGVVPPEPGFAVLAGETYYQGSIGGTKSVPIANKLTTSVDVKASFTPVSLLRLEHADKGLALRLRYRPADSLA